MLFAHRVKKCGNQLCVIFDSPDTFLMVIKSSAPFFIVPRVWLLLFDLKRLFRPYTLKVRLCSLSKPDVGSVINNDSFLLIPPKREATEDNAILYASATDVFSLLESVFASRGSFSEITFTL